MNLVEVHSVDVKLLIYYVHSFVHVVVNAIFCRNPFNKQTEEADEGSSDDNDIPSP